MNPVGKIQFTQLGKFGLSLTQLAGATGTRITVTVFSVAMPKPVGLGPNPLALTAGTSGTLTATLSPTPTATGTLNVTSSNPQAATVPASVSFTSGQVSVAIPVSARGAGSATITASANGGQASATVNVKAEAQVYYIHPDHLNTPRFIADETQKIVWRWDQQEPFGATPPNDDPDGDGIKFDFPLRFPGQYFDRETNLAYNWMRDYDPAIGRYVQSDPIGLRGGLSTYLYVHGMPTRLVDPIGLATCRLKHVYGDPFEIEEYEYGEMRWRVPRFNSRKFVECLLDLDLGKQNPIPKGPIAILVCIVPSIDIIGSPVTILLAYTEVFLQQQRIWRTERWCEEGCPPKEVFKEIVGGGIEKLGGRRYIRTDWDWPRLIPSESGGGGPGPFGQ
jgi:RHS repeat-associated protein